MNKIEICKLLPHTGLMCLIDQVISKDKRSLVATTSSHLQADNPLLYNDRINSIIGIEYAAQTMAIHAAIEYIKNNPQQKKSMGGYLATTRNVNIYSDILYRSDSNNFSPLIISVNLLMQDTQGYTYEFTIDCDTNKLISGRLTIFLKTNS
jgi:predicted hotdog family 3-hydroxylacyl-ACP dehydratase